MLDKLYTDAYTDEHARLLLLCKAFYTYCNVYNKKEERDAFLDIFSTDSQFTTDEKMFVYGMLESVKY